jgi:hypothetical protein
MGQWGSGAVWGRVRVCILGVGCGVKGGRGFGVGDQKGQGGGCWVGGGCGSGVSGIRGEQGDGS